MRDLALESFCVGAFPVVRELLLLYKPIRDSKAVFYSIWKNLLLMRQGNMEPVDNYIWDYHLMYFRPELFVYLPWGKNGELCASNRGDLMYPVILLGGRFVNTGELVAFKFYYREGMSCNVVVLLDPLYWIGGVRVGRMQFLTSPFVNTKEQYMEISNKLRACFGGKYE